MKTLAYIALLLVAGNLSAQVSLEDILIKDQSEQAEDICARAREVLNTVVTESNPRYADVIDKAVEFLGEYGSEDAIPALWERYSKCTHSRGKSLALIAIGKLGDSQQIDKLRTVFESANEPRSIEDFKEIQPSIAAGLAILSLRDRSGFVEMNRYLKGRDRQLQRRAAKAFALSGDDSSTYLLVEMLSSKDRDVRAAAVDALVHVAKPNDEFVIKGLRPLLEDNDEKIRMAVAKGLAALGDDSGTSVLERELKVDKFQPGILKILYQLGDQTKATGLVDLLAEELSSSERRNVETVLVEIQDKDAIDALIKLTASESKQAVLSAAKVLGETAGEKAVGPLLQLLKNEDDDIQDAALRALSRIGSPKSLQPLKELKNKLDEGDPRSTRKAHFVDEVAVAIANVGDPAGLDHFFSKEKLESENPALNGIEISSITNPSVVDRMLDAISDKDLHMRPGTRIDIIDSLANFKAAKAVPVFITDLKDLRESTGIPRLTNEEVVRTIEYVGNFGNPNHVGELGNWLDNRDPRIRVEAAGAILKLLPDDTESDTNEW